MPKKIVLLGSTGSIGCSTLKVAQDLPEELQIIALAAHSNIEKLAQQVHDTGVKHSMIAAARMHCSRCCPPMSAFISVKPD
jgi:1-deoxy-D-xylulose 5-phosphate reductoisomerase